MELASCETCVTVYLPEDAQVPKCWQLCEPCWHR